MRVQEVVQRLRPRAVNMRLTDPSTGFVSEEELRFYLQSEVLYLATTYQLDMFLSMDRQLLVTSPGVEAYPIPATLYGWWSPDDDRTSGLSVALGDDGTEPLNLRYRDPARYHYERSESTDAPSIFTVADGHLWFSPIPDDTYTIQGVHKRALALDDDLPNMYVRAIVAQTLYRMASDKSKLTSALEAEQRDVVGHLVNNEHRLHQKFKRPYSERTYARYSRRYGGWFS